MKLITWNVNSIRQRLPRLLDVLGRHAPDVVCLQETKVGDDAFPHEELQAAGYGSVFWGQKAYNGVAILARSPMPDASVGFDANPIPEEARVVSAIVEDTAVVCAYVVNGKEIGDPAYDVKLEWLDAFTGWIRDSYDPSRRLVVAGDFNIAPDDRDVYDARLWSDRNLVSVPERARFQRLLALGLTDLGRASAGDVQGPFTFWDYRAGAFHKGWGLRIDLVLGSAAVAQGLVSVEVDREERKSTTGEGKPSDHAPVVVVF